MNRGWSKARLSDGYCGACEKPRCLDPFAQFEFRDVDGFAQVFGWGGGVVRICNVLSCSSSTGAGAPVRGSVALCVFGKAITSRIVSSPAAIATIRSIPGAMPP